MFRETKSGKLLRVIDIGLLYIQEKNFGFTLNNLCLFNTFFSQLFEDF